MRYVNVSKKEVMPTPGIDKRDAHMRDMIFSLIIDTTTLTTKESKK
jgi:hypothetical protein